MRTQIETRKFTTRFRLWADRFYSIPETIQPSPATVRYFRRNFVANLGDSILWNFGDSFAATETIIPVFASTLTTSPLVIGLIPALKNAGGFLPQLFMASRVEKNQRQLPLVLVLGALERLPFIALTLSAFWLPVMVPRVALGLFLFVILWKSLGTGFVALPWQELIARVIPVSHRGRYFGIAFVIGSLLGILGASLSSKILATFQYPVNFGISFFLATVSIWASFLFLNLNQEPADLEIPTAKPTQVGLWQRVRSILGTATNFRVFILSRSLTYLGNMAYGFVAVYSLQQFDLSTSYAAIFTACTLLGRVLGSGIWGIIGDRSGHKRVLTLAGLVWVVGLLILSSGQSLIWIYGVFTLLSLADMGNRLGDFNIAMELGPESQRPTYMGITRTLSGPFLLIAPILGGSLVAFTGYQVMFAISLAFSVIGLGVLWLSVQEPRKVFPKTNN